VNRAIAARTALLAGFLVVCACWAGGQTPPLRDPSVAQKPLAPLGATDPVVRKGLFTIDVVVTDAAGNPVSDLAPWDFTTWPHATAMRIRNSAGCSWVRWIRRMRSKFCRTFPVPKS
jgi:hypothetical protein